MCQDITVECPLHRDLMRRGHDQRTCEPHQGPNTGSTYQRRKATFRLVNLALAIRRYNAKSVPLSPKRAIAAMVGLSSRPRAIELGSGKMILTASETHDAVKKFWNDKPCDSEVSCLSPETQAYFEEIERERYAYQRHILDCFDQIDWHNKKVLEIGTGVGTDARQLIARGAAFHGINVDEGSCAMTRRAFAVFGVPGTVEQMDATAMQFPDATFDVVYAFGVLHHIPEVSKAVAEFIGCLDTLGVYFSWCITVPQSTTVSKSVCYASSDSASCLCRGLLNSLVSSGSKKKS